MQELTNKSFFFLFFFFSNQYSGFTIVRPTSNHYVEYLVSAVAKANIDSLPILDLTDCVQELRRRGISLPERGPWDTDEIYRGMCQKVCIKKIRIIVLAFLPFFFCVLRFVYGKLSLSLTIIV